MSEHSLRLVDHELDFYNVPYHNSICSSHKGFLPPRSWTGHWKAYCGIIFLQA